MKSRCSRGRARLAVLLGHLRPSRRLRRGTPSPVGTVPSRSASDGAGRGVGVTEVDWDLLADHLGGALQGTPEEARVAHLVATDPAWREPPSA